MSCTVTHVAFRFAVDLAYIFGVIAALLLLLSVLITFVSVARQAEARHAVPFLVAMALL